MTKINERFTRTRSYIKDGKPYLSYEIFLEGDLDEHYSSDVPVNSRRSCMRSSGISSSRFRRCCTDW